MSHPWSHRAIRLGAKVREEFKNNSVYHEFSDYYRVGYSHNTLVNVLLRQFSESIEDYIPRDSLLINHSKIINELFSADMDISLVSWDRETNRTDDGYSYSLFLSRLLEKIQERKLRDYKSQYPNGLPFIEGNNYYTLEEGIDWFKEYVLQLPQPFFSYVHYFPPHHPYKARREFNGIFANDGFKPVEKPQDIFTEGHEFHFLLKSRTFYNEFIRHVDSEFGRLFNTLEESGILENSWVVLTSDHGELHERGITGHVTATLYQPIVRIPLLIFNPNNKERIDIHTPTSAVDVMTTLLHLTDHNIPNWAEGSILPPFNPNDPAKERNVYTVQARFNDPDLPLTQVSVSLVNDNYKLIYYRGYAELDGDYDRSLLYNIKDDPEEMNELSNIKRNTKDELENIVKNKLEEMNAPFENT